MAFTDDEISYLRAQPLARLATVSSDGQPDAVPVGLEYDGTYLYVGGRDPARTRKYLNVREGNDKVCIVVDDLASTNPWTPRFLRVYGTADFVERDGYAGPGTYMRIAPTVSWSWNLGPEPAAYGSGPLQPARKTVHQPPA
jgi:pyridoxamine 5'-phosphate oxidase family protein